MEAKMELTKKQMEEVGSYFKSLNVISDLVNKRNACWDKVHKIDGEISEQENRIAMLVKDKRWYKLMRFHELTRDDHDFPF